MEKPGCKVSLFIKIDDVSVINDRVSPTTLTKTMFKVMYFFQVYLKHELRLQFAYPT